MKLSQQEQSAAAGAQASAPASYIAGREKWVLMGSMALTLFVLQTLYAAAIKVFLPNQVADIDAVNKVANLATIYALMSLFTTIATPLSGALSDRLRTRWGRRTPFIAGCSLVATVLTFGLTQATTLAAIATIWIMAVFFYNMMQGPMTTLIADRFQAADRGTVSGVIGAGMNIGIPVGVMCAGYFSDSPNTGYLAIGTALLACCMVFVVINREPSSEAIQVEPFHLVTFLKGFYIDPRKHPDFAWAFLARFCMYMGYTLVSTYLLYILQDYIGLDKKASNAALAKIFSLQLFGLLSCGILGGLLSDYFKRRKIFVIAATILIAVGYSMPLIYPTVDGMYMLAVIVGMGYGAFTAVDLALMTQVLPKEEGSAGKNLGLLIIALNIPLALGPVLAAGILGATGNNYTVLFSVAVGLVTLSAFLVVPIKSVR